jgi:hypothetical protein
MRSPKKKATAAKLCNWRVSILRNRAEYLGIVRLLTKAPPRRRPSRHSPSMMTGASGS